MLIIICTNSSPPSRHLNDMAVFIKEHLRTRRALVAAPEELGGIISLKVQALTDLYIVDSKGTLCAGLARSGWNGCWKCRTCYYFLCQSL